MSNPKDNKYYELFPEDLPNGVQLHWTCNDHPTCKTCKYYYCSCDGTTNDKDPRMQNMEHADRVLFSIIRTKDCLYNTHIMDFIYWTRIYDEFNVVSQKHPLTDPEIMDLIVQKHGEQWRSINK